MSLYEQWDKARSMDSDDPEYGKFWTAYLNQEADVYQKILSEKSEVIEGTLSELSEKFGFSDVWTIGFMEGIDESLKNDPPKLEELEENSPVRLEIDFEKLFYNMVKAPNQNLQYFPEWDDILSEEKRKELTKACKTRNTIVKTEKVGRNDPCPCGSGKKYKKCCGKNA